MSLQRALLLLTGAALLAGVFPALVALNNRAQELEARARSDLLLAPRVLTDLHEAAAEGLRMHARATADAPGLAEAVRQGDRARAVEEVETRRAAFGSLSLLVRSDGEVWAGPPPGRALLEQTRSGLTAVGVLAAGDSLYSVALAPLWLDGVWIGAAGVGTALGRGLATTLAGLTRTDVVILNAGGRVAASTDTTIAARIARFAASLPADDHVEEARLEGRRYLFVRAGLGEGCKLLFVRDLDRELALLPQLRQVILFSGILALGLAILLGTLFSVALARPVRALAAAADRLAGGDFEAPLGRSSFQEVNRVAEAFERMRRSLAARLHDLQEANRELAERQARLDALKAEILHRERLAANGRLVSELAHEIRNPVANLRNCLELIRRRLEGDEEGREFADMAIDELLRMHELAEQMLRLNRRRERRETTCEIASVASEVAGLARVGTSPEELEIRVTGEASAAIAPEVLKQVLLNLIENAREALPQGLRIDLRVRREPSCVCLEVEDNGPGIPPEIRPKIFDPFFTTKGSVDGTGLGLFIAEGLIRKYGGRITTPQRRAHEGACFRIELVPAEPSGARATPVPSAFIPAEVTP